MRVDVISERKNLLLVAVVVLHRDLKVDAITHAFKIDDLVVKRRLVLVQVLDKGNDTPGVVKLVLLVGAFVLDRDQHAPVEECEFAQTL